MASNAEKSLGDKIIAVRGQIGPVEHDKWVGRYGPDGNPAPDDKYGYWVTTHHAVNNALMPVMNKHGLFDTIDLISESHACVDTGRAVGKNNIPVRQVQGLFRYTVHDTAGNSLSITVPAYADDTGDKGPGKAITYAFKAGRSKMFSISTGDDEEGRPKEQSLQGAEVISEEQLDELWRFCDEAWGDDAEAKLKNAVELALGPQLGIESLKDLPAKHLTHAMTLLKRQAKRDGRLPDELSGDDDV